MADQTPALADTGALITQQLVERAGRDPAFRARLLADPRAAVRQELGLELPARLTVSVHEETPQALHLVLPLAAPDLTQVAQAVELGDREVADFADKQGDEVVAPQARMRAAYDGPIEHQ